MATLTQNSTTKLSVNNSYSMKIKFIAALALSAMTLASCDETTDTLGISLNTTIDHLDVASQSFNAISRSVAVESVISRNSTGYLGCIKDPETGAHITGDFMTPPGRSFLYSRRMCVNSFCALRQ